MSLTKWLLCLEAAGWFGVMVVCCGLLVGKSYCGEVVPAFVYGIGAAGCFYFFADCMEQINGTDA